MKKKSFSLIGAILIAVVAIGALAWSVRAQELSPPYVITLEPWSYAADAVAVNSKLGLAYVVAKEGIAIFDELEVTATLNIASAVNVATDPERGYAYVTRSSPSNHVTVLSGTRKLTQTVNVGGSSQAAAVLTTTGHAYIALPEQGEVAVLSGTTNIIGEGNLSVGANPSAIGVNHVTGYVYVANAGDIDDPADDSVSIIDGNSNPPALLDTVTVGDYPVAIAVNPTTGYVYVANNGGDSVSILQGTEVIATVTGISEAGGEEGSPGIAVNSRTGLVYVLSSDTSDIENPLGWVKVLSGTQLLETVELANEPLAINVDPNSEYVYTTIGRGEDGAVTVLRGTIPLEVFPMGQTAYDIAIDTKSELAYIPIHEGHVAVFGRTIVYNTDPLNPSSGEVTLPCTNTQRGQNLPIIITIPAGAIPTTQTRVLCSPLVSVDALPDYLWARQGFRLAVAKMDGSNPITYPFEISLSVTMAYLDPLPSYIEEDELEVRRRVWLGDRWDWPTDYFTFQEQLTTTNYYTITVDRTGEYALVAFGPHVYLPLIMKGESNPERCCASR
jgi:DNA-binding beta-propeller fold protein YncE